MTRVTVRSIRRVNVKSNQHLLLVATLATLIAATSAFADDRAADQTRQRGEGEDTIRRDRDHDARRGDESRTERRREEVRRDDRDHDRRDRESDRSDRHWRDGSRHESNRGRYDRGRYGAREPYHARGRVSRVSPYRGGYHVWIGGARYPFFVPSRYYDRNRFRIGVVIGLGGYYNPLGYYDYYDDRDHDRYDRYGRYDRGSTRAEMSGTVESVDDRRYTFVMRNDATGNFITIHSRDRNVDLRPGDYVEVRGNWRRTGLFEAYDVDLID